MNKEIKQQVTEFKKRESELILALDEKPEGTSLNEAFNQYKEDRRNWLNEVGGFSSDMKPKELERFEKLIASAENKISYAAWLNANLTKYIRDYSNKTESAVLFAKTVEDNSQLEGLAEISACDKIKELEKFNRKRNGKSFLNVLVCKFKRAKKQEHSQDSQGPSHQ